jgi:hypothetical protein
MRIEEIGAVLIGVTFLCLYMFMGDITSPLPHSVLEMVRYLFYTVTYEEIALFVLFCGLVLLFIHRSVFNYISLNYFHLTFTKKIDHRIFLTTVIDLLRAVLVIVVVCTPAIFLLVKYSFFAKYSSSDQVLFAWDKLLFGVSPYFYLPTVFSQDFVSQYLIGMYDILTLVVCFSFILFFLVSKKYLFRVFLTSFILSIVFSWPFFILFPSLDPGNYFIREFQNDTSVQDLSSLKLQEKYEPNEHTWKKVVLIQNVETMNFGNKTAVPISCFPSMHAIWGLMCVVLLTMYNKKLLPILVVWYISMLLGGVYVAQHYVVDYILAVPVAVVVLILSIWLIRHDGGTPGDTTGIIIAMKELLLR